MSAGDVDAALRELLTHLTVFGYRFITPTPETHRRVLSRKAPATAARDLRDIFGWNLPFSPTLLPAPLFERLASLGVLGEAAGLYKSRVRVSSVGERLFLHSGFPTDQEDAVFFGPDSYRFVRFVEAELCGGPEIHHLVDIGAGAGVGAIAAGTLLPKARLTLTDINPLALRYAKVNARHAGIDVELVQGNGIDCVADRFDLAITNPPFIVDAKERTYRHGGELRGAALSLRWASAAARMAAPGGRVLLYTGSAIVDGIDQLEAALRERLTAHGCTLRYSEIDPDIFSEELDQPAYGDVERIAAVGAVIAKQAD